MMRYFIEKAIKRKNSLRVHSSVMPRYKDLNTIVILFNALDIRHIQKAKTTFQKDGKQVVLWGANYTNISLGHSQATIIDNSEMSFWGFPSKQNQKEFEDIEADVLIDMTRDDSLVLTYLMMCNKKIPFRIGFKGRCASYYDVICDIPYEEHVDLLVKAVLSLLQEG